jgi:predicted acetyltransferase
MDSLRLRPLTERDESPFMAAHSLLLKDGFTFALGHEPNMPWAEYLERLDAKRSGRMLGEDEMAATLLAADVNGTIVGRTSIRHELNDFYAREIGHIGYGVVPDARRRGYATEILSQSLVIARSLGIDSVLVMCADDNLGSATTIERCGGALESVLTSSRGGLIRRYWID